MSYFNCKETAMHLGTVASTHYRDYLEAEGGGLLEIETFKASLGNIASVFLLNVRGHRLGRMERERK